MKKIIALSVLIVFATAVNTPRSYGACYKHPASGDVAKAKVCGVDHLFVCTASVSEIFVNDVISYAIAKSVVVVAPAKAVTPRCNSPGK